jgi:hypothetical protein
VQGHAVHIEDVVLEKGHRVTAYVEPNPNPGEVWLIRDDIGLPKERRTILIIRVYPASTGTYPGALNYTAIDGLMDGRIMTKLGTGWLLERLF